jgi:hypothetical protein
MDHYTLLMKFLENYAKAYAEGSVYPAARQRRYIPDKDLFDADGKSGRRQSGYRRALGRRLL